MPFERDPALRVAPKPKSSGSGFFGVLFALLLGGVVLSRKRPR